MKQEIYVTCCCIPYGEDMQILYVGTDKEKARSFEYPYPDGIIWVETWIDGKWVADERI
jgi:hypothetical protein